jgi:tRNA/rRNA methyltransferase
MTTSLANFALVLFRPISPGNIGSAARALKNMGLHDLRIVAPQVPFDARATAMAVHGRDVLQSAVVYPDLLSALYDRTLVVGTTARTGLYRREARAVRDAAPELVRAAAANRIAIVFGPEDCGLTNQELKLCQRLLTIPTAPQYPSLNLAQAVMILSYELMLAAGASRDIAPASELALMPEVEAMLSRIADALSAIGFVPEDNPDHIMRAGKKLR